MKIYRISKVKPSATEITPEDLYGDKEKVVPFENIGQVAYQVGDEQSRMLMEYFDRKRKKELK